MTGKSRGKKGSRKGRQAEGVERRPVEPERPADSAEPANGPRPGFPVIGIGASAGGLEALKRFFSKMPKRLGMAIVLVPHLDPKHKSMMVELLSKQTDLPVTEANENVLVERDHIYVIPPNRYLSLTDRHFSLVKPEEGRAMAIAIDGFFRSLAADAEERAIGIVLSGTGNYGVAGLREIKIAGGIVLAQDPDTAGFDQMPRAAIAAGVVDSVLPPEDMPRAIIDFAKRFFDRLPGTEAGESDLDSQLISQIGPILKLLHGQTRCDFQYYRKKMILRRVLRRMGLRQIDQLGEYLGYLGDHPEEVVALRKDLLIGVTSFFREQHAFEVLERLVIPKLVQESDGRPVRVWVPACSTGEEAYSLAMLLLEGFAAAKKMPSVQIFATDIDEDSLNVARHGSYLESIVGDVSKQRLQQFFVKVDDHHYRVSKQLRESIVFAAQNLISDSPYSKLDLLSCRNFLIYLESEMQQKLVAMFHFVLNSGGTLVLGQSESIGRSVDLFEPISKSWRVFRRVGASRHDRLEIPIVSQARALGGRLFRTEAPPQPAKSLPHLMQKHLLEDYTPAAVLIDRHFQVLCQNGPLTAYLEFQSGEPSRDLFSLLRQGLRGKVRAAVQRAIQEKARVVDTSAQVKRGDGYVPCTIEVKPVQAPSDHDLLLVSFRDRESSPGETAAGESIAGGPGDAALARQLEDELKSTREELQGAIDDLEGSHGELKASHEEVMSMNEELQSANEELETSKEELQSLNEELTTVNNQLQSKVDELERANNDITNLLASTDIAVVFLDAALRVVRFTPPAVKLLSLLPSDAGRPYGDLSPKFNDPQLLAECRLMLHGKQSADREVWSSAAIDSAPDARQESPPRCYLRRIRPYHAGEKRIEGIVVTLIDITDRIQAEAQIRRFAAVLRDSSDAMLVYDLDGKITAWNGGAQRMYGYTEAEALNMNLCDLVPENLRSTCLDQIRPPNAAAHIESVETQRRTKDGRTLDVWLNAAWLTDEVGKQIALATTERDVTDRKKHLQSLESLTNQLEQQVATRTEELRRNEDRLRAIVDSVADAIITIDQHSSIGTFNRSAQRIFGYAPPEIIGQKIGLLLSSAAGEDADSATRFELLKDNLHDGARELVGRRKDGTTFPAELAVGDLSDGFDLSTIVIRDVSERNELQRQVLQVAEQEQRRIGQDLHDSTQQELSGLGMIAHSLYESLEHASPQAETAARLSEGIGRALENVRHLSRGLVPAEIGAHGLCFALSELAKQTNESGQIDCRFECDENAEVRDQFVATHLYRIAQEAITNVLKHASAQHIVVALETRPNFVTLKVTDDGSGIQSPRDAGKGIGLKVMSYRVGLIGGSLRVEPLPGGGTQIACTAPLR
ncbi:MAG TPA: chemotaxis protein CheB [Pirellulales bacterium]|nr:chemotaxis protein CheB [Pirellulales bacterium]